MPSPAGSATRPERTAVSFCAKSPHTSRPVAMSPKNREAFTMPFSLAAEYFNDDKSIPPNSWQLYWDLKRYPLLLLALLTGCSHPISGPSFDSMVEEFVLGSLALSPVSATQAGYHQHK